MSEACGAAGSCPCEGSEPVGGARVDRRTFLVQGAISSALLALAACSLDATGPDFGPKISNPIVVAEHPELSSPGGVLLVNLNGNPVAVVRTGDDSFLALSRVCPHQGATIGVFASGFQCPRHGARFDATGRWTGGERTGNMRSYATSFDAVAGTLTVG